MEEIWKDIKDYEGYYQVSSQGRIKSLRFGKDKIKNLKPHSSGYIYVKLCVNYVEQSISVHRIVALHFLRLIEGLDNVNHIDEDKTNNHINNLEWVTSRENICYSKNKKEKYSKYTGVTYSKKDRVWFTRIKIGDKRIRLGNFKNEIDAGMAYVNYCKEHNIKNKYNLAT